MVSQFKKILKELQDSKVFKDFQKEHKGYYLAHGFLQLQKEFAAKAPWQIGFYSKKEDKLAMFDTDPLKFNGFEDAFKKDGHIDELKDTDSFLTTDQILKLVKEHLEEKYSEQVPSSYMIILQVIKNIPVYNITSITEAFAMINTRLNAKTGEMIMEEMRSILDLRHGN